MNTLWAIARLQKKEIFMPDIYQTTDGRQFGERYQAESHQRDLDGSSGGYSVDRTSAASKEESEREKYRSAYNQFVSYFNAGNWDGAIKTFDEAEKSSTYIRFSKLFENVTLMWELAKANNGDYESAFTRTSWGKPYPEQAQWIEEDKEYAQFYQAILNAGKKAWEKKHGRAWNDADFKQVHIDCIESNWTRWVKADTKPDSSDIEEWEKLTGREITKADEIRIAGKPFIPRGLFGKRK
jgi:hypothetical protein